MRDVKLTKRRQTLRHHRIVSSWVILLSALGLMSAFVSANALKYGPASYNTYPAYYNSHPLPTPEFFKGKVLKMVMEVDSPMPAKWHYAVAVLMNIEKAFAQNGRHYQLELVAYGPGVRMLSKAADSKNAAALENLAKHGLKIRACHNAMLATHIARSEIFPFARVVPAGVLEVARKIMQGYVPIKP